MQIHQRFSRRRLKYGSGLLACVAVAAMVMVLAAQAAGLLDLTWFTLDGGGGQSSGGRYTVAGTVGQPDAGMAQGGRYAVVGGFWSVATTSPGPGPTATPSPPTGFHTYVPIVAR